MTTSHDLRHSFSGVVTLHSGLIFSIPHSLPMLARVLAFLLFMCGCIGMCMRRTMGLYSAPEGHWRLCFAWANWDVYTALLDPFFFASCMAADEAAYRF